MNIIKNGFELLDLRKKSESCFDNSWLLFKESYNIKIEPPFFKKMHQLFDVKRNKLKNELVFHPGVGSNINILLFHYFGNYSEYLGLYDFVSLDESITSMKNSYSQNDEIHNMELAYIGDCIDNMALMVGYGIKNLDVIFLECTNRYFENEKRIVKIADNIFDFISKMTLIEKEKIGNAIDGYDKLYKNWGEDFWRIRDEQE